MFSRRSAMIAGGGLLAIANTGGAHAQSNGRDPGIVEMLAAAERQAETLLDIVTEIVPADDLQSEIVAVANSAGEAAVSAVAIAVASGNEEALLYVRSTEYDLAVEMIDSDISLLPEDGFDFSAGPLPDEQNNDGESLTDVLLSIFCQTLLGTVDDYGRMLVVLGVLGLDEDFRGLGQAVRDQRWSRAAAITRRILMRMVSREALAVIGNVLGPEVSRRFMIQLGARCVPFIGWALLLANFVQSIKDNWERIEKAI